MRALSALAAVPVLVGAPQLRAQEQPLQVATAPEPARAPEGRRRGHFPEGLFLPVGLTIGQTSYPNSPSALSMGGEASLVLFPVGPGYWTGVYADAVHDGDNRRTRISAGLEAGYTLVGVDGGPVVQLSETGAQWGGVVRPLLTFSFLTLYGRWGWLSGDGEQRFRELGVLLKFPILLEEGVLRGPEE